MQSAPATTTGSGSPRRPHLPAPTLATRLKIQADVIRALMIRYIVAKYGRGNLGFLWIIVEPIFLLSGVIVIWTYLHASGAHGVSVAAFVISGYVPLTLWRHLSGAVRMMSMNYGLLYHRRITVFDIIVARSLTEIAAVGAGGVIVYFILLSVGVVPWIENPPLVLAGWLSMSGLGFGVSCIVAGLSEKSDILENLIQPTQYLILPISGCFFMVSWLPISLKKYVLMNPLVHAYEIIRAGFFGSAVETYYSFSYVIICSLISLFLGIIAMSSSRKILSAG